MSKYKLRRAEPMVTYKFNSELVFRYATVLNMKRNVRFAEIVDDNYVKDQMHPEENLELLGMPSVKRSNSVLKTKELTAASLGVRLVKIYIEAANFSVSILTNRNNNLEYLRTNAFQKLKEQFHCDISEQDVKSFAFSFGDQQIGQEYEGMEFGTLIDKSLLNFKGLDPSDPKLQFEFSLVWSNLDVEANFMRETVVKKEQESCDFAILVRMLDESGKLWNGTATIAKLRQSPALSVKNTRGETKVFLSLDEKFSMSDFILDKVKNHVGIEFLEKGEKPEDSVVSLVFLQSMQEVNRLIEAIITNSSEKNGNVEGIPQRNSSPNKNSSNEELNEIFNDKGYEVKQYGLLRMKYERLVKYNSTYELGFYKIKSGSHHKFQASVPIREIEDIKPKVTGSRKLIISFKNPKKFKTTKLMFKSSEEGQKFINNFVKLMDVAENSKSAILLENSRTGGKQYTWLSGPTARSKSTTLSNGKVALYSFNVINLTAKETKMNLIVDFARQTLIFKDPNGKLFTMIEASKLKNFETDLEETKTESILFEGGHRMKVLFMDNKERFIFRSALSTLKNASKFFAKGSSCFEEYKLFITTFNVGYAEPPDLGLWLEKSLECDVVVIGMQETKAATWLEKIQLYLNQADFQLITLNTMWKMSICVYVKSHLQEFVSNVETVSKPTGIANIIGNKGGVGVGMKIKETSFCFISSHLAARPGRAALRKANFYDIMKHVRPCTKKFEPTAAFDYFFFIGDTNFRIDYPFDKTLEAVEKGDLNKLKPYDELSIERTENNEFSCFYEPEINFKPTYRRIRQEPAYSNKKNQSPSWTDRILSKAKPGRCLDILEYNSCEVFFCSDHRPVYSIIKVDIEPHFTFFPALHARAVVPLGEIIFNKLVLNYDFEKTSELGELAPEYTLPVDVYIAFFGKFLNNYPNTAPLNLTDLLIWNGDKIPIVHCVVADVNYLKNQFLDLVVYIKSASKGDTLIGQASLTLKYVEAWNYDKQFQFSVPVHFYGKNYGHISGEFSFKPLEP